MAKKSSKLEHQSRLRIVQDWILSDHVFRDIVKSSMAKWEISERQAERYYTDAYAFFSEGEVKNIEQKRAYYIQRKRKLLADMNPAEKRTAAGIAAANKVLDSMAELEGLKVNKHELTGKDGEQLKFVVSIT